MHAYTDILYSDQSFYTASVRKGNSTSLRRFITAFQEVHKNSSIFRQLLGKKETASGFLPGQREEAVPCRACGDV